MFLTVKETSNAGRCSHSAVEPPSTFGLGLPAAHAASKSADVQSFWCTARTCRPEYANVVYDSPKPNSKRGSMLFCTCCQRGCAKNENERKGKEGGTYGVEVAVINLQPLAIHDLQYITIRPARDQLRRIILRVLRDRIREPPGGVHIAIQHIHEGVPRLRSSQPRPQHRCHILVFDPRLNDQGAHRMHDDDRVGILRRHVFLLRCLLV